MHVFNRELRDVETTHNIENLLYPLNFMKSGLHASGLLLGLAALFMVRRPRR